MSEREQGPFRVMCEMWGIETAIKKAKQLGIPVPQEAIEEQRAKDESRYITLLRAAHTLLKKQYDSGYVLNLLTETVFYDEAECDGNCLMEDIEYYFDEIGVEIPESERINP